MISGIPANKWEDLGQYLLNDTVVLSHIRESNPETSQRCKRMFDKWLERNATWSELITALENVGLTYLAGIIKEKFSSITGK